MSYYFENGKNKTKKYPKKINIFFGNCILLLQCEKLMLIIFFKKYTFLNLSLNILWFLYKEINKKNR